MRINNQKLNTPHSTKKRQHYPLWVCIGVFSFLLLGLVGSAFSYLSYSMVKKTTISATQQLLEQISDITELTVSTMQHSAYNVLDVISQSEVTQAQNLDDRMTSFPYIASFLIKNPDLYSIYTAYENGDFFYVRTFRSGIPQMEGEIPETAFFEVQSIENGPDGKRKTTLLFFNKDMTLLSRTNFKDRLFDPRTRVWYRQALQSLDFVSTAPYHYFSSNEAGVTISHVSKDGNSVVGIDMTLDLLSEKQRNLRPTPSSRIALIKPDGSLVAYVRDAPPQTHVGRKSILSSLTHDDTSVLFTAREEYRNGKRGMTEAVTIDGEEWFLFLRELTDINGDVDSVLLMAMPFDEIMDDAEVLLQSTIKLALIILVLSIPIAWLAAQYAARPLRLLAEQAERIRQFRFDDNVGVVSYVKELDILARTITLLKENITRFLVINLNISSERDFGKLLETILSEILDVASADGGAICLLDENGAPCPT